MVSNWFTLSADTFLWLKGHYGLAYNTDNKKKVLFSLSENIEKICQQLLITENLYSAELTQNEMRDREVTQWMDSLIKIKAGFLSENVTYEKRPVSLNPILKVQDKKEYYEKKHNDGFGGEILENLHDLIFYINGSDHGNNTNYKQTLFPLKGCQTLDSSKIISFIRNSRNPFLNTINLVGNVFSYPGIEELNTYFSDNQIQSTVYILIQDFIANVNRMKEIHWQDTTQFIFLIDSVFDVSLFRDIDFIFSIRAFVRSENDYSQYLSLLKNISDNHTIKYIPLYNNENLDFFRSNVFIDQEVIEDIDLPKNEVFMHQTLNIEDFGKLTIVPDGLVYANVNAPSLGTINDSPYSIVYKEFIEGKSWFKIRAFFPCNECIYQWLCPSPSNYETVIGQPNLCKIHT